jgi:hypothetical protein
MAQIIFHAPGRARQAEQKGKAEQDQKPHSDSDNDRE